MSTTSPEEPPPRTSPLRTAVSILVLLVIVIAARYALRGLRFDEIAAALRGARVGPMIGAVCATLGMQVFRGFFWRFGMRQDKPIPIWRLVRYSIVGNAASALLPVRAGEAVRIWMLVQLERVKTGDAVGAALSNPALNIIAMMLVLAPLPLLFDSVPPWVSRTELGLVAVSIAIIVGVHTLARRDASGPGFLARVSRALSPLASWPRFIAALLSLTLGWCSDLVALVCVGAALGLHLPAAAPFLVLLSVNLAIAVPAAPAQLGTHEAGTLVALLALGVPRELAVAYALLYHAAHIVPLLVAGALDAPLLIRAVAGSRRAA